MATKKTCPSCKKEIDEKATKCPECQKQLELLYWEIEGDTGEKDLYSGENSETSIRNDLLSGKLKLTNRCRQYITVLTGVKEGQEQYETKQDKGWKTLREYADSVYPFQILYNPVMADGKRVAQLVWVLVGFVVAVGWNMSPLLAVGINALIAVLISAVLLILTPTVVGIAIGSVTVGTMYGLPPLAMAVRSGFSILVGAIVGGVVGWTVGFAIGAIMGATKKKVLR